MAQQEAFSRGKGKRGGASHNRRQFDPLFRQDGKPGQAPSYSAQEVGRKKSIFGKRWPLFLEVACWRGAAGRGGRVNSFFRGRNSALDQHRAREGGNHDRGAGRRDKGERRFPIDRLIIVK